MTPAEFRQSRRGLHLTQPQAAALLCVSTRTVAAWEAGERPVDPTAARLLALLVARPELVGELRAAA